MPMKGGYNSPKPETEVKKTQVVATGSKEPRATVVDYEAEVIGVGKRVPGHGQGGAGH